VSPRADLTHLVDRARRAFDGLARGGHAAAERVLRETAAAIERRGDGTRARVVRTWLGRLLIERGRTLEAMRVFDAGSPTEPGVASVNGWEALTWRAWTLTDLAHLTQAEAVCLGVLRDAGGALPAQHLWTRAVLARVYVAQRRLDEALALDLALDPAPVGPDDTVLAALVEAIDVRRLLAGGQVFEAARRLAVRVDAAVVEPWPVGGRALAIAAVSELRVRAATGDLAHAGEMYARAVRLTADAGLPLWSLRARLAWAGALARARQHGEAQRLLSSTRRRAGAVPPLLRQAVQHLGGEVDASPRLGECAQGSSAGTTVSRRLAHSLLAAGRAVPGRDGLEPILADIAAELGAVSLAVVATDGIVVVAHHDGSAVPVRFGRRAAQDGAVTFDGAGEMAVPLRQGPLLVGAVAARLQSGVVWGAARQTGLELAAEALAPLVVDLTEAARLHARVADAVPSMVGHGAAMTAVRESIARAARAPFAVLVEGESGAGKELVARAIHALSARRAAAFCDLNCAALPDELLESELFGHAKGAFTGAVTERPGLFEHATGGTVFLDEVADLSLRAQAKLLRVLQQQEVRRVGEATSRRIDVRVISAANRDMREAAAAGRFRDDLLYRLDVIRIRVPPLRERPEDVAVLAAHFWASSAACVGTSARLTAPVIDTLARYAWPGNVRELQNVLAALAAAAPARGAVPLSLLPARIAGAAMADTAAPLRLDDAREAFERAFVEAALARAAGGRTRAALALGLSRQGLAKVLRRLRIPATPAAP
jgi:DNA-binding NtrC family response regulator